MTRSVVPWSNVVALAAVLGLRLIGLFMVLPFFSSYAMQLSGATPLWVGFAMGIYGLTQACFQIPFGMWSDHADRKQIMLLGLAMFVIASVWAAEASNIVALTCARALQGSAAVGSVGMALMADLTPTEDRPKAMAILGVSVGSAFLLAFILGPVLHQWFDVSALFLIAAGLGLVAGVILISGITPPKTHTRVKSDQIQTLLHDRRLNFFQVSAFLLHATLVLVFFVLPLILKIKGVSNAQTWHFYVPALCIGVLIIWPWLRRTANIHSIMSVCGVGIAALFAAPVIWLCTFAATTQMGIFVGLVCFFSGFTLLEAWLPSWVSQYAPISRRGMAMGIQSSAQFLGMFVGSIFAGALYTRFQEKGVLGGLLLLVLLWLGWLFYSGRSRTILN